MSQIITTREFNKAMPEAVEGQLFQRELSQEKNRKVSKGGAMPFRLFMVSALGLSMIHCAPTGGWVPPKGTLEAKSSSLGFDSEQASIIGGEEVQISDPVAASTVDFYFVEPDNTKAMNFCTGTLVDVDMVLTAAHCFVDVAKQQKVTVEELAQFVRVGFGNDVVSSLTDARVQFVSLDKVKVHEEYRVGSIDSSGKKPMKDIALVKLSGMAPSSAHPVAYTRDRSRLSQGVELTLAGFGLLNMARFQKATRLMKVKIAVDKPNFSETQFMYTNVGGKSACSGDSGGPAYIENSNGQLEVIGVTSWGDGGCRQVGVYTSIPAMAPWIEKNWGLLKLE